MTAPAISVSEAVASRKSIRSFLDKPVDPTLLREILQKAARAPSGGNLQPWHIHLVTGARLAKLKALMAKRTAEDPRGEPGEYDIYPREFLPPYRDRAFAVAEQMYGALGIAREDKDARRAWFARNFQAFGAPVLLFCYLDRRHGPPQWSDAGMYLQTVMLLLREAGLDSCPQECWARYPKTIDAFLDAPAEQMLFSGMAIGWRDPNHPVNGFHAARAPLDSFLTIDPGTN